MASQISELFKMDYDLFKNSVSQEFRKASDDCAKMAQDLKSKYDPLVSGAWIGEGANKFKAEMESDVIPVIRRLHQNLGEAANLTAQMEQIIHEAETEASNILGTWTE